MRTSLLTLAYLVAALLVLVGYRIGFVTFRIYVLFLIGNSLVSAAISVESFRQGNRRVWFWYALNAAANAAFAAKLLLEEVLV